MALALEKLEKIWFPVTWTSVFAISAAFMYFESRLQLGHGKVIAELVDKSGIVQYRGKEVPVWSYAVGSQRLYNNDVLATGDKGTASVRFAGGRVLDLEPNTLVVLSTDQRQDQDGFVVNLISGGLAASGKKSSSEGSGSNVVVRVQNREVAVKEPGARVAAPIAPVSSTNAKPAVSSLAAKALPVMATLARMPTANATGRIVATEVPAAAKGNVPTAQDLGTLALAPPKLAVPQSGGRMWTLASLAQGKVPELNLRADKPRVDQSTTGVQYLAQLGSGAVASSGAAVASSRPDETGKDSQRIVIKGEQARPYMHHAANDKLNTYDLEVHPSARRDADVTTSPQAQKLKLASLADQPAGPVVVRLQSVGAPHAPTAWLTESPNLTANQAQVNLHLVSGKGLPAVAGALASAGQFAIAPDSPVAETGAFAVREGVILGSVEMKNATPAKWATLRKELGADCIFSGKRSAVIGKHVGNFKGATVYAVAGMDVIPIEVRLLRENPAAAKMVGPAVLFSEPVKILSSSTGDN